MELDYNELALKYKDKALELLSNLIKFNSVLDKYNPASKAPFGKVLRETLDYFLDYAQKDGFSILNDDGFAGHIEYGCEGEILGVLGHLDVVPAVGSWDTNPFEMTIKDGKIYARGSIDDKGPVVCAYIAMQILKDLGIKPKRRIRLIVGCDEESGSRCLEHYFKSNEMPSLAFSPDAEYPLIYGEKAFNNFNIIGEEKSIIKSWDSGERVNIVPDVTKVVLTKDYSKEFKKFLADNSYNGEYKDNTYIVYGKAAHGSIPQKGINSNYIMADFINSVKPCNLTKFISDLFSWDYDGKKSGIDFEDADMGSVSINLGVVSLENSNFVLRFDCRVPKDEHCNKIDMILSEKAFEYGFYYLPLEKIKVHFVDPKSELVGILYDSYKYITGDEVNKPFTIGGGTYAKLIPNCVAFGAVFPGEDDIMHAPNEYIKEESFIKNIAIYLKAIYELVK